MNKAKKTHFVVVGGVKEYSSCDVLQDMNWGPIGDSRFKNRPNLTQPFR
jgi:hypothetical protein